MKVIFITIFITVAIFLTATDAAAHPAWGIVVDRQGQVYFSDIEAVWKIDFRGNVSVFRAGVSGRHVHDITIDAEDNIYGVDNTYNPQTETYPRALWRMTPKGEFSYLVPMTNNLPIGKSVWRDSGGNTYSIEPYNNEKKETKIIRRAPDGKTSLFAGGKYGYLDGQKDTAEFSVITDVAFGRDDAIYLTDTDKVRKIDVSGMVSTIYRPEVSAKNRKSPKTASRLYGLTVDEQNNVIVADSENRRVLKISFDGKSAILLNTEQPWTPNGVALRGSDLYVLEGWYDEKERRTNTRVRKLSPDGKITVLATLRENPNQAVNDNPAVENTETSAVNGNPAVEDTKISHENQKNFPYVLFGAGVGFVTAIPIVWYGCRKLFA